MKSFFCYCIVLLTNVMLSQSYAPPAGQVGSTAIAADSPLFLAWASGSTITRGLQDIANPTGDLASFGVSDNALGAADGMPVSLGDRGSAILTFENPIANGSGFDFAVFENGFSDVFLELAFVEVSSDGIHFFRFPSHSEVQTTMQVDGFGDTDCRYINNLAGKYRLNFGTPFDLSDLPNDALLNKNRISHIKIIDVVGSINPAYASYDSFGNIINDPYATAFPSSGFDLDAVGVMHQTLGLDDFTNTIGFKLYPNPAENIVWIEGNSAVKVECYDISGKLILKDHFVEHLNSIDISAFKSGIYFIQITTENLTETHKIIVK